MDNLIHKNEMPVTIGIFITPGQCGEDYPRHASVRAIRTIGPSSMTRWATSMPASWSMKCFPRSARNTTSPRTRGRAIGGASSGAICAFTVAWERPDEFRKVISLIGSFTDIRGGHVYPDLIRKSRQEADPRLHPGRRQRQPQCQKPQARLAPAE